MRVFNPRKLRYAKVIDAVGRLVFRLFRHKNSIELTPLYRLTLRRILVIESHLIGDIYDAALDPALWPGVLEGCAGFVGGVASNRGVVQALEHVFQWKPGTLTVPEDHTAFGAIGAAMLAAESAAADIGLEPIRVDTRE